MQAVVSILNFDDGEIKEINSPRSREACLRAGIDTNELISKPENSFQAKGFTKDMIRDKYLAYERRRKEKIEIIKKEREEIIACGEKMQKLAMQSASSSKLSTVLEKPTSTALELEMKRLEAVKKRQEREIEKMVKREQDVADLQQKIKHAEEEEARRKKEHDKKVQKQKDIEEKKKAKREHELAEKEKEDLKKRKQLQRREEAFEKKRKEAEEAALKQLAEEAKLRDIERQQKLEEHRKKTEMFMLEHFSIAEQNRAKMIERETFVKTQLELKKEQKKTEMLSKRESAAKRIKEALEKHHQLHDEKKASFMESQQKVAQRAKELAAEEREKLKKEADMRDRKNKQRLERLAEAARNRQEYREEIMSKINSKDEIFVQLRAEREEKLKRHHFEYEVKLQELRENVERMNRKKEFAHLQTLRNIEAEDERTKRLLTEKEEMQRRHKEELKQSVVRKHQIASAMEIMRVTNDYTLLDQIFSGKKGKHGRKRGDDLDGDDARFNQTA